MSEPSDCQGPPDPAGHVALLTLLVITDLDGYTGITGDPRATIGLVIGLGLLGTGVAYILYYFIVRHLGTITASSATYIPPVVALAIGWLLVNEPLDILDAAAVLLILAGVVVLRSRSPGQRLRPERLSDGESDLADQSGRRVPLARALIDVRPGPSDPSPQPRTHGSKLGASPARQRNAARRSSQTQGVAAQAAFPPAARVALCSRNRS